MKTIYYENQHIGASHMKLTRQRLNELIYEVINESQQQKRMNIATANDVRKHREELKKERELRRKKEKEHAIMPDGMKQLSKGIITEDYEEDENGMVHIEKHKLDRLLKQTREDVERWARGMGWKPLDEWLRLSSAFSNAQKGKFESGAK